MTRPSEGVAAADILVVDDEPAIQSLIRTILEDADYTVRVAGDGAEALAAVEGKRPALILLDVMMPQIDGWSVLERLRDDAGNANIPVILLTASTVRDHHAGSSLGVRDVLRKPFSPQRLLGAIQAALA